jgi:hypothetical protein
VWKEWDNKKSFMSWVPEEVIKDILLSIRLNTLQIYRQRDEMENRYYRSIDSELRVISRRKRLKVIGICETCDKTHSFLEGATGRADNPIKYVSSMYVCSRCDLISCSRYRISPCEVCSIELCENCGLKQDWNFGSYGFEYRTTCPKHKM